MRIPWITKKNTTKGEILTLVGVLAIAHYQERISLIGYIAKQPEFKSFTTLHVITRISVWTCNGGTPLSILGKASVFNVLLTYCQPIFIFSFKLMHQTPGMQSFLFKPEFTVSLAK